MPVVMPPVLWVPLSISAKEPTKKRRSDAGWDFYASFATSIPAGGMKAVATSVALAIPDGWYGQLQGRSGLASRMIQPRAFIDEATGDVLGGAIDSPYRGEIIVLLANLNPTFRLDIKPGEKIAQMMFHQVPDTRFERPASGFLPESDRGTSGFGDSDGSGVGGAVRVDTDQFGAGHLDDDIKSSVPYGPKSELPSWIISLAWNLYRTRRDYTNKSDVDCVRHIAEVIDVALQAEGKRALSGLRLKISDASIRGLNSQPPRLQFYNVAGLNNQQPTEYSFGPGDTIPHWLQTSVDMMRERFRDSYSHKLGLAINRILKHRRENGGSHGPMDGPEIVQQAAEIWGKNHPITKDIARMFGVDYPPKSEERPDAPPANPPAPPFKVPDTLNIVTSRKTDPTEAERKSLASEPTGRLDTPEFWGYTFRP